MKNKKKAASRGGKTTYRLVFDATPEWFDVLHTLWDRTGRNSYTEVIQDSIRAWLWVTEALARGSHVVEYNPLSETHQVTGQFYLPKIAKRRRTSTR